MRFSRFPRSSSTARAVSARFVIAGAFALLVIAPGCFQRSTYPAIPTAEGFNENPNTPAGEQAIIASVQYVASRWGLTNQELSAAATDKSVPMVPKSMIVNLPRGMRKSFYERIATKIGPGVEPATATGVASGKPVYFVKRVWLRFNQATVDVLRPMTELGSGHNAGAGAGQNVYQMITLRLEGGLEPWRVVYARTWKPGADPLPAYYFVPPIDDPNQFAKEFGLMPESSRAASSVHIDGGKATEGGVRAPGAVKARRSLLDGQSDGPNLDLRTDAERREAQLDELLLTGAGVGPQ